MATLLKKTDFNKVFNHMKTDYWPYFMKLDKKRISSTKRKYLKIFNEFKKNKPSKSMDRLMTIRVKNGFPEITSDVDINSIPWKKMNEFDIVASKDLNKERIISAIMWEATLFGYTEKTSKKHEREMKSIPHGFPG